MNRLLPLVAVALAACGGGSYSTPPASPSPAAPAVGPAPAGGNLSVTLGQQFSLHPGQSAMIGGASSVVQFTSVANDTRCESGTQCQQAGNAAVNFTVTTNGSPTTVTLNTNADPKQVPLGQGNFKLVSLEPGPMVGGTINPATYVATVCVCR
jgi:hypothetical protein